MGKQLKFPHAGSQDSARVQVKYKVPKLLFYKANKLTKSLQTPNHLTALLNLNGKGKSPAATSKKLLKPHRFILSWCLKKGWWVKDGLGHFWSWFTLSSLNIRVSGCPLRTVGTIAIVLCPSKTAEIIHAVSRTWASNSPANPALGYAPFIQWKPPHNLHTCPCPSPEELLDVLLHMNPLKSHMQGWGRWDAIWGPGDGLRKHIHFQQLYQSGKNPDKTNGSP